MTGLRQGELVALRWRDVDLKAKVVRDGFYEHMGAAGMKEHCGCKGWITFHSLRHTFGTRMAAVGVPMRTLQEWMGHRDFTTTLVYADFAPDATGGAAFVRQAFGGETAAGNAGQDDGAHNDNNAGNDT